MKINIDFNINDLKINDYIFKYNIQEYGTIYKQVFVVKKINIDKNLIFTQNEGLINLNNKSNYFLYSINNKCTNIIEYELVKKYLNYLRDKVNNEKYNFAYKLYLRSLNQLYIYKYPELFII